MSTNEIKTKEELLAHTTFKQVVITSLITAISTIFITLISSGYFRKEGLKENLTSLPSTETTIVHTDPVKADFWENAKEYYIWFNAQYKNASTVHAKGYYVNLMQKQIKFTLILIQPSREIKNDFKNFEGKFHDMRLFLKKAKAFGIEDGYDVSRIFPNIYIFQEEKIPSISFFITKDKEDKGKAIFYIEDKGYFIDDNRKPVLCLETSDQSLLKKFESRYIDLLDKSQPINQLEFKQLTSDLPDSTFFLK